MVKEYGYKDSRFSETRRDAPRVRVISMRRATCVLCHRATTIPHSIAW